jgi:hypothetical protein
VEGPTKKVESGSNHLSPFWRDTKQKLPVVLDYSLYGVTIDTVTKRLLSEHKQRLGIFARSWSEWITVETAINMEIYCICLKRLHLFNVLTKLYPNATVVMWKEMAVIMELYVTLCS